MEVNQGVDASAAALLAAQTGAQMGAVVIRVVVVMEGVVDSVARAVKEAGSVVWAGVEEAMAVGVFSVGMEAAEGTEVCTAGWWAVDMGAWTEEHEAVVCLGAY